MHSQCISCFLQQLNVSENYRIFLPLGSLENAKAANAIVFTVLLQVNQAGAISVLQNDAKLSVWRADCTEEGQERSRRIYFRNV